MAAEPPEPLDQWRAGGTPARPFLNATAVAVRSKGLVILGPSGAGKSSLAIELLAYGAQVISDDGLFIDTTTCRIEPPPAAPALIEARGIGLIQAPRALGPCSVDLIVDLSRQEPNRLPPRRMVAVGRVGVPLILGAQQHSFAAKLLQVLLHGCSDLDDTTTLPQE